MILQAIVEAFFGRRALPSSCAILSHGISHKARRVGGDRKYSCHTFFPSFLWVYLALETDTTFRGAPCAWLAGCCLVWLSVVSLSSSRFLPSWCVQRLCLAMPPPRYGHRWATCTPRQRKPFLTWTCPVQPSSPILACESGLEKETITSTIFHTQQSWAALDTYGSIVTTNQ